MHLSQSVRCHRLDHGATLPGMTSTDIAPAAEPASVPTHRRTGKPLKVAPLVSRLLDRMIETGERYTQAAPAIGMHVRAARKALDQPHVLNELRRRKQVFRAAISAGNIVRLAELRDQDDNKMAAINAIKVLEQIDDDPASVAARNRAPGVVIVIGDPASHTAHMRQIEPKPLIDQQVGSHAADDTGE